jgi:hypothetical protein
MSEVLSWVAAPFTGGLSLLGTQAGQKFTKNLFRTPKPPEAPSTPSTQTTAVQQAASEAAQRRSKARGFRSTILSQNFLAPDNPALKDTFGS